MTNASGRIVFTTERLVIREVTDTDFPALCTIYTDEETMQYISSGRFDWTPEEIISKYMEAAVNYPSGYGIWVVTKKENGQLIGEAGLFDSFNAGESMELGYILQKEEWGKGYGTEICRGLIEKCFKTPGIKKVIARMYAANTASIKLSEKSGMQLIQTGIAPNGEVFCMYEVEKSTS